VIHSSKNDSIGKNVNCKRKYSTLNYPNQYLKYQNLKTIIRNNKKFKRHRVERQEKAMRADKGSVSLDYFFQAEFSISIEKRNIQFRFYTFSVVDSIVDVHRLRRQTDSSRSKIYY
jgi:hypothetical protein